jgi:uncharacterized glyoxalase superfamily protein PhnB
MYFGIREGHMAQPDLAGIAVRDMEASLKFYRLLGLDIPENAHTEDHVEYITPSGFRIAWDSESLIKSFDPDWVNPIGQRIGLAFKCSTPAEVDELYNLILQNGYHSHRAPWDAVWGQRYAVVIDPDGILVDLFAAL